MQWSRSLPQLVNPSLPEADAEVIEEPAATGQSPPLSEADAGKIEEPVATVLCPNNLISPAFLNDYKKIYWLSNFK